MNVTLIALVRQGSSWAPAHRLKELGMKQESLFYNYYRRYSSKWFIVLLQGHQYWTLASFAVLRRLTQKALQYWKRVTQLSRLLTGRLQEGPRMFVAVLTHEIGRRMHVNHGGSVVRAEV